MKSKASVWKEVQDTFDDSARHYDGKYLEVDYIMDDGVEVSFFRSETRGKPDEIYVNFDIMYGIVYPEDRDIKELIESIKKDIQEEYEKNGGKVSDEFIEYFAETYGIHLPGNIFFAVNEEDYDKLNEEEQLFIDMLTSDLF